jgi:hypothetical protein
MLYRIAADATLILHLAFILFVVLGAVLGARWRWLPLLHLPAAAWGVYVELAGAFCPLTALENRLLVLAGRSGYRGGFVEHYLLPVIYPAGLTRDIQQLLAATVVVLNVVLYAWLLRRRSRRGGGDV